MTFARTGLRRRHLLAATTSLFALSATGALGKVITGGMPWQPDAGSPPRQVTAGPWVFFTSAEGAAVEAMVDRLIPPDARTPGGKDAGCAVFIDRQLVGPYGDSAELYMRGPFVDGQPEQGDQSALTPAARYRMSLAAIGNYVRGHFGGRTVDRLSGPELDGFLTGLEKGDIRLDGADGQAFFRLLLTDTKQGFFSDPVHGGNRGMASWKMIGYPGARYDYRDWVGKHNQRYPRPPVSIATGQAN
jgi:gluconate 2-dehydrogenase gamma chain